ncbi:ferritin-like domain-containing protein [Kutzneria albida]|uniref:VioB-polyketide synthase n=1 Tax=Kutzneria albida DSM 43870 TaxID=1449976 RepID=W5W8C0_9PSEU|nr:ferritin-like domain-containing protein [Kutzneria albida]AHH96776.1 VioB - polyketide synthase [Kutzneria albida DSM 43870]
MSVFDLPRLHFAGVATANLPTGTRGGTVDLATNTALTADGPFDPSRPAEEYHEHLDSLGPRLDELGQPREDGLFSAAKGSNFGGSGHFSIDARIVSTELSPGVIRRDDPLVGRSVDMWGHYNPYLATTANRARVFDVDPASAWTTTLMVGRFCFGRLGRSHDVGYVFVGEVRGMHAPRWHNPLHVRGLGGRDHAPRLGCSTVYQFAITQDGGMDWLEGASASPAASLLCATVESGGAGGVVVQFALGAVAVPTRPDAPERRVLRGTIAPWWEGEPRGYPAGRLLVPVPGGHPPPLHNLTVRVEPGWATLNAVTAVPVTGHGAQPVDLGDLELRTAGSDRLVATVPREAYLGAGRSLTSGIIAVPTADPLPRTEDHALLLVGVDWDGRRVDLLREREILVQAEEACQILDHPRDSTDAEQDVEVELRSFVRGEPGPVEVEVHQFFNPRALPRERAARSATARSLDVQIVRVRTGGAGEWAGTCTVRTDDRGYGRLAIRGARAGTTRLLLATGAGDLPCDPEQPGSARLGHDELDALGHWSAAGSIAVRVLPDDWRLAEVPQQEATFDLLYREVFAFYELFHPFMKEEVFSLADRFRVNTHARLIWQMCDPRNKSKTYYMPPTRDLSQPKAMLLLKFLRAQSGAGEVPALVPGGTRPDWEITTRGDLVLALRQAVTIELAVLLQYLYAAFSVPTPAAARAYHERGEWTADRVRLACGAEGEALPGGLRGGLFAVAREEMTHFLLVNNVLMAIGEPFYVPRVDFGTINARLAVPLDFALEPLGLGALERFAAIERPESLVGEISGAERHEPARSHLYGSLSELYAAIRAGLQRVPELFMVDHGRGGGEHHLFLRESINAVHPDYQLEVDDLSSALFAIDVVTEQGEGGVLGPAGPGSGSHFEVFLGMSRELAAEQVRGRDGRLLPWSPAYPTVRNPTLHEGDPAKDLVTDPGARELMRLFNRSYFMQLQLMVQHFNQVPDSSLRRSELMNMAIEVMTGVMRPLAEVLVMVPSGRRGRTAGPSFELESVPAYLPRPDVAARAIALRFAHLAAAARRCFLAPVGVVDTLEFLSGVFTAERGVPPRRAK